MTAKAIDPKTLPVRSGSGYPAPLNEAVKGRHKQALGEAFGLANFGVNLVRLEPGAWSSLRHWHEKQDELVYVLEGAITLVTDAGPQILKPGMVAGFAAGRPDGHHLINHTKADAWYLEVGDRNPGDVGHYSEADLKAVAQPGWQFTRRDGSKV